MKLSFKPSNPWTLYLRLKVGLFLAKLRSALIGSHATHVLCDSLNGKLLVPASDFYVGRRLAYHGEYDHHHVEKLLQLVRPDSRVLFVGSHIGALVIPIAKRVSEVVAIEANPSTFETLKINLLLNGCENVSAFNVAAFDENTNIQFLVSANNTGGSKVMPRSLSYRFIYETTVNVKAVRLDDFLPSFKPSLIVMDIEGAEVKALQGMPELMRSCETLMVEFLPDHIEHIAGMSCEEFVKLLPFESIHLLDDPAEQDVVSVARARFYYGGADLICTH